MTAADFKRLSLGFVIDFCTCRLQIEKGEEINEENKYHQLKDVLPFVEEEYENGVIDESRYRDFIADYKELEGKYGWEYD